MGTIALTGGSTGPINRVAAFGSIVTLHPTAPSDDAWFKALHDSSSRLRDLVGGLDETDLRRPSFAAEWTVADVVSHLGSGAEICHRLLEKGRDHDETGLPPETLHGIWDRWNGLDPVSQRDAWLDVDASHLGYLDQLVSEATAVDTIVPYFAGPLTLKEFAGYRLSEQSIHGWDAAFAFDQTATVPPLEVGLLWSRIDLVATRFNSTEARARLQGLRVEVSVSNPDGYYALTVPDGVRVSPGHPKAPTSAVTGPAEAILRIFYGRHLPTDDVRCAGAISPEDLTALFPGY